MHFFQPTILKAWPDPLCEGKSMCASVHPHKQLRVQKRHLQTSSRKRHLGNDCALVADARLELGLLGLVEAHATYGKARAAVFHATVGLTELAKSVRVGRRNTDRASEQVAERDWDHVLDEDVADGDRKVGVVEVAADEAHR